MNYDPAVLDLLAHQVLNCVCAELNRVATLNLDFDQPGCPCRAAVISGTVAWDACCDGCGSDAEPGQLTVALTDLFLTERFPTSDRTLDVCQPVKLAAQYTITILRCSPGPDKNGNPPSADLLNKHARITNTDFLTLHHAVTCCLTTDPQTGKKRRVALSSHRSVGPQGGCVGSELVIILDTGVNCCPEEIS